MKIGNLIRLLFVIPIVFCINWDDAVKANFKSSIAHRTSIKLGAYYFDGWTGATNHITESLKKEFPERKSKWGWVTSTPGIMVSQINSAADAGLSFFSFCWYNTGVDSSSVRLAPLNRALNHFLKARNRGRLEFNLLIANHPGFVIRPSDWESVTSMWIRYFKEKNYLRVEGKPLITFFEYRTLLRDFGSADNIRSALERFRSKAVANGLKGVNIAICIEGNNDVDVAKNCGFDILTAYNNHNSGFKSSLKITPIDSLTSATKRIWDNFANSSLPYIPVVTLNWDPRPWAIINKKNYDPFRYTGFSEKSVYKQVVAVKKWVLQNPRIATREKIAVLYAWNEYGEGAWLTPSGTLKEGKNNYLKSLKRALSN